MIKKLKYKPISILLAIILLVLLLILVSIYSPNEEIKSKNKSNTTTTSNANNQNADDNNTINTKTNIVQKNGITYVDGIMIVNKTYSLPNTYNPGNEKVALDAFEKLKAAAEKDNISLWIASGFRSYQEQVDLYNQYVQRDGKKAADIYSARPGYSEHQTGLTFDVNNASEEFNDTAEAKWLEENAYKYGFIIRYPKGKQDITGYSYESWHIRYLGTDKAKLIHDSGKCIEEYYNITSKYKD